MSFHHLLFEFELLGSFEFICEVLEIHLMPHTFDPTVCWQLNVLNLVRNSEISSLSLAIQCSANYLTYADLLQRSSRLREKLHSVYGLGSGSRVVIAFDDAADSWVGMTVLQFSLGLLGASFTILDTRSKMLSAEARGHVLKVYKPDLFVAIGDVEASHPDLPEPVHIFKGLFSEECDADIQSCIFPPAPSEGAFVDWTSGSTGGLPKGCMCSHGTLANMYEQKWSRNYGFMNPEQIRNVGYNLFYLWYWWQPLCHGGTSVLLRDCEIRDLSLFESALERNRIDAIDCFTPSLLKVMCMHLPSSAKFPNKR